MLFERKQFASGTIWAAAGLVGQLWAPYDPSGKRLRMWLTATLFLGISRSALFLSQANLTRE